MPTPFRFEVFQQNLRNKMIKQNRIGGEWGGAVERPFVTLPKKWTTALRDWTKILSKVAIAF
jgi:hypothetical protein